MEKKRLVRTLPNSANTEGAHEEALKALNKNGINADEKLKREVKRLNMDVPQDIYELVEAEIGETGQTVKGFFVMLAKQYFRTKGQI